mmetsp:Transcript_63301/g.169244  ORF Transcript_63301/g.169244 Transcript_63301/m.169244 type:complete len:462 (+) Transcript_63301:202-1587(+)
MSEACDEMLVDNGGSAADQQYLVTELGDDLSDSVAASLTAPSPAPTASSPIRSARDPSAGSSSSGPPQKKQRLFKAGEHILALWREQDWREAEVIEARPSATPGDGSLADAKYYVHWCDFNRRCDSWIDYTAVDPNSTKEKIREVRESKKRFDDFTHENHDDHEGLDEASLKEHEQVTKVKNVNRIQMGRHIVETWYFSPLPKEIWKQGDDVIDILYFCEFTLNFYKSRAQLERHHGKGCLRHPPGDEIYRRENVSVFEVDGAKSKEWCRNLCYLAKMFLDHKTLYYDVDPFLFYIICESDDQGFHVVGYFSKEKHSENDYNLACILTLPQHQRKGYGKFIISFSYELSKLEKKVGTPERPLSDLGRVSYESHWARELLLLLRQIGNRPDPFQRYVSITELSAMTSFKVEDIKSTLERLHLLTYHKGQWIININPGLVDHWLARCGGPGDERELPLLLAAE